MWNSIYCNVERKIESHLSGFSLVPPCDLSWLSLHSLTSQTVDVCLTVWPHIARLAPSILCHRHRIYRDITLIQLWVLNSLCSFNFRWENHQRVHFFITPDWNRPTWSSEQRLEFNSQIVCNIFEYINPVDLLKICPRRFRASCG